MTNQSAEPSFTSAASVKNPIVVVVVVVFVVSVSASVSSTLNQ